MAFGWQAHRVALVPLDQQRHLENALRWLNDPEITRWTLVGDLPLTRLAEEEFFARASMSGGEDVAFAIETLQGEHIGFSGLHRIDYRQGTASSGTILGRRDFWGQGIGSESVALRARYAFEALGLRLLLSEAMVGNVASVRMLLRAGYTQVGRIPRRYWKRGAFHDVLLFTLERSLASAALASLSKGSNKE